MYAKEGRQHFYCQPSFLSPPKFFAEQSGRAERKAQSSKSGPHAVGPDVLSLCLAADRLAETPFSSERRSVPVAPDETPAPHFPSRRSKHYLPTPRAAMSCLF